VPKPWLKRIFSKEMGLMEFFLVMRSKLWLSKKFKTLKISAQLVTIYILNQVFMRFYSISRIITNNQYVILFL